MHSPERTPRAIWVLIIALASLQPIVHAWIAFFPPEGTVPTGLAIPDSALFIESMDMFSTGFASPYATCRSDGGGQAMAYYSVPHLWLYGALGMAHRLMPLPQFLFYGLANGLGALFYLYVIYRFLRIVVPAVANRAFTLFALGGGPGGLLYLLTGALGMHGQPGFESWFFRFAVYDLMEGPHFNPTLYFPRLYYTLSLGCCLGGLGALIRRYRDPATRLPVGWMVAIALGSFLDARYGVFVGGLLLLYLLCAPSRDFAATRSILTAYGIPSVLGLTVAWLLLRTNPAVLENHLVVGSMAVWFSPFLLVVALPLATSLKPVWRTCTANKNQFLQVTVPVLLGYLLAYGVGYVLYQIYYGNLLAGRDGSVAANVSDWALLGAVVGGVWGMRRVLQGHREASDTHPVDWMGMWFLAYAALSLSGFGQGWFLRFGPQRLQVFLWLPLCVMCAQGLLALRPRLQTTITATLLCFGITSIAVAHACFQGPLGRRHGEGIWPQLHAEIMAQEDETLLESLGAGTVLAPAPASDVVVRRRGNPVVFGVGSFNLTDLPYAELRAVADTFFSEATSDGKRQDLVRDWCVEWVYAPHTWPVHPDTLASLERATWLEPIAHVGRGGVFRVRELGAKR